MTLTDLARASFNITGPLKVSLKLLGSHALVPGISKDIGSSMRSVPG